MVLPQSDTIQAPTLPPPFINLSSLANLRDVGGLPISQGQIGHASVRKGILYRSADPSRLTFDDLKVLHADLGVHTIFDLRAEPEIQKADSLPQWTGLLQRYNASLPDGTEGITRVFAPVFKSEDYSPESIAKRFASYGSSDGVQGFVEAYSQILSHLGPTLRTILTHLTTNINENIIENSAVTQKGILIHCTAGKDRAGSTIAIFLSLLGVSDSDIATDYNLTETGLGHVRPLFVERCRASGAFGDPQSEEAAEAAFRMTGARKEVMVATLAMMREKWGSVEGYVKEVAGVDDSVLKKLRDVLIVTDGKA